MSFCCVTVDSEFGLIFVFQDFLPFKPPLIELLEVDAVVEVGVVGVPRKRRDLAILWCELVFCNFRELKKQPLLHDFYTFISGSSHIGSVLIGVEYQNYCRTLDIYLHFAILLGQIESKLNYKLVTYKLIVLNYYMRNL